MICSHLALHLRRCQHHHQSLKLHQCWRKHKCTEWVWTNPCVSVCTAIDTTKFSLNVFTEFAEFSQTKIFAITVKPASSCVRDQDGTTAPTRHVWETGSLNWAQFMLQWFISFAEFSEFLFHLGKSPMLNFDSEVIANLKCEKVLNRSHILKGFYGFEPEGWTKARIEYWSPIGFVTVDHSLAKEVTYRHLNLFLVEVSLVYISSWDPIQRAGVVWLHLSVGGWSGVCSIHCCLHRVSLLVECNAGVVWLHLSVRGWSSICSIHCCLHIVSFLFGLQFGRQEMYLKIVVDITRYYEIKVDLDRDIFYRHA